MGPDAIVEIYESEFGKRIYHDIEYRECVWVFGMVKRIEQR